MSSASSPTGAHDHDSLQETSAAVVPDDLSSLTGAGSWLPCQCLHEIDPDLDPAVASASAGGDEPPLEPCGSAARVVVTIAPCNNPLCTACAAGPSIEMLCLGCAEDRVEWHGDERVAIQAL